ncbi:MAG: hypothetical protein KGZ51_07215 [Erysipelothrix sp.]|jgi:hypothetical protein|nr:hypothetical protein [Erysipelothrix sp.]
MSKPNLILSRKGLDSSNSNKPSLVWENGALVSLPIPSNDTTRYADLKYLDWSYERIITDLKILPKSTELRCHCDPDIYAENKKDTIKDWKACFGQHDIAQLHLEGRKVKEGDIFLFFGWFKKTQIIDGQLRYVKGSPDQHVIYGYLEIGEIIKKPEIVKKYYWHPHAQENFIGKDNHNALYIASEFLLDTKLPGFGTFKYSPDLVLTKEGYSRSKWELPKVISGDKLSYHNESSKKDDYFQSACIGQEFVIEAGDDIKSWIIELVRKHRFND